MLEPLSLSVVPSSHFSNVAVLAISWRNTLLRLTINDRRRISQLPRVNLALLQEQLKMNTASTRTHKFTELMAKAIHVSCKISCCAVAKPSAEGCDFLATLTRSPSTIDGELQASSHLRFFQTTIDITNKSSMNTQTRIWGQRPPTSVANLAVASPPTKKSLAHCKSEIWKELAAHPQNAVRWFLFGSYVPTASTLEENLLAQNPSTR